MKHYQILLSNEAVNDLIDAYDWYELQRKNLGHEFELSVEATLNQLSRNPFEFQEKYRTVRIAYLQRFPYGIHFLIDDEFVRVIAIFHTSRDPKE